MDRSEAGKRGWAKTQEVHLKRLEERSLQIRQDYSADPKYCKYCNTVLPFEKRRSNFCNQSCAAYYNNNSATRRGKSASFCTCGNVKRKQNKYCPQCIEKHIYNRPQTFDEIRDSVARKRFLIEKRGYGCESCGLSEWLDKPIALELHHIDGNADNNSEANLKLLCPNCHAQTAHYKGAVKGKNTSRQIRRRKRYAEGKTW